MTMKRIALAAVTAVLAALTLAACGSDDSHTAARICVDHHHKRVKDSQCHEKTTSDDTFVWYYILLTRPVPQVGRTATGGGYSAPKGANVEEDEPNEGVQPNSEDEEENSNSNSGGGEEEEPAPAPVEPEE